MAFDDFLSASERLRRLSGLTDQLRLIESARIPAAIEAARQELFADRHADIIEHNNRIRALGADAPHWRESERLSRDRSAALLAAQGWLDSPTMRAGRDLMQSPTMTAAHELALRADQLALPTALANRRPSLDLMAERIQLFGHDRILGEAQTLTAFTRTSAFSEAIRLAPRVDADLLAAVHEFSLTTMPAFESFADQRAFLDAAGFRLPRWPRVRLLTAAEKRRRFKARLKRNAETPEVKKAKSLVHRYELTMREIIDAAMAEFYGEGWEDQRLPLCGCKTLLGRRDNRGGGALDHADYTHYYLIMGHPQHFTDVFYVAFPDPQTIGQLINDAGRLRAASHHAHVFTQDDLRDLRIVWRTLEAGLLALTNDVELDGWY